MSISPIDLESPVAWERHTALSAEQRLEVLNLLNRCEARIGREAIDEGRRRVVVHGWTAEHWLRYQDGVLEAYALANGSDVATIEMCGGGIDADLLETALRAHGELLWWTRDSETPHDGEVVRTLQMLHTELPCSLVPVPEGALLRTFEPDVDESPWIEQNNAAFADHPEQGAWTPEDLAERTHEPWFDPSGFLILEIDGQIAASCWTKVHELHPDRFGEIYVISVNPSFQGRGLGRVMVTQGLEVLRRKGVTRAALFVDESNLAARRLYESLGFSLEREDRLVRFVDDARRPRGGQHQR